MNFLERLNPRERFFVIIGGGVLLVLLVYLFVQFIIIRRATLSAQVEKAKSDFLTIQRLKEDIDRLPASGSSPDENQLKSLVFQQLEKHTLNGDIKSRTESLSRREERVVVELRFKGQTLKSILDFVHDIEYGSMKQASTGRFEIKRSLPGKEIYDGSITVISIRPKPGGK